MPLSMPLSIPADRTVLVDTGSELQPATSIAAASVFLKFMVLDC